MTIKECIDIVDQLKPNQYSTFDKVRWLSQLDQNIMNDIILTHEEHFEDPHFRRWLHECRPRAIFRVIETDADEESMDREVMENLPEYFRGYDAGDTGRMLLAEPPYDELYVAYLKMKVDEENGETARYNNSATMFNEHLLTYERFYNRTHMPYRSQFKIY